jgi:hypothetical protein
MTRHNIHMVIIQSKWDWNKQITIFLKIIPNLNHNILKIEIGH